MRKRKKDQCSSTCTSTDSKGHVIGCVTLKFKVTRHSDKVTDSLIELPNPKYVEKKDQCSSTCTSRDSKGHVIGCVTLKFKVTRHSDKVTDSLIELPNPKYVEKKKKFNALAHVLPEIANIS